MNETAAAVTEQAGGLVRQSQGIMEKVIEVIIQYGMQVLAAIVIFIVGRWVAKFARNLIAKLMERSHVDAALISFTTSLSYVAMMIFVIVAALEKLNIRTTSFIAILGAAGLAIGLALQGSLANFAAGVLMIIFKPFKIGDFVEGGGVAGSVKNIQIFTTTLATPDNKKIIVPNSKIMSDCITNFSSHENRRINLTASCSYGDDLDKVKEAIRSVLNADPRILKDPAPTVAVSNMADSSIDFVVRPWVATADYWAVYFSLTEEIKKKFDKEGISIPFPQRDVHLYQH